MVCTGISARSRTAIVSLSVVLLAAACRQSHAPDHFFAKFETSKGEIVFEVTRELAPARVDRFYKLIASGFYDTTKFYCVSPEAVKFGISGDPAANLKWQGDKLPFEPVKSPHIYGAISFDEGSPTGIFIDGRLEDQVRDAKGAATIGRVVGGMENLRVLSAAHRCEPDPKLIAAKGDAYLESFRGLDYIRSATVDPAWKPPPPEPMPPVMIVTVEGGKVVERWIDRLRNEPDSKTLVESNTVEATISPHKHYLTYTRLKDDGSEVALRNLETGQETVMTADSATCTGCESAVVWSPDESHLSYISHRVLHAYTLASNRSAVVYTPPCAAASGNYAGCDPASDVQWAGPDRLQFTAATSGQGSGRFTAAIDGSAVHLMRAQIETSDDDPKAPAAPGTAYMNVDYDPGRNILAVWDKDMKLTVVDMLSGYRFILGTTENKGPKLVGWLPLTGAKPR